MTIERPMFPPRAESVDSFSHQPAVGQPASQNRVGESRKPAKGLSRRGVLAGVAVAAALPIPAAAPAAGPDPIFAAIEKHRTAAAVWDAAVDVRSNFNDLYITNEQRQQRDELDNAVEDAWRPCEQAGVDLINTSPTTLGGIARALNYIREQMLQDDGIYMPTDLRLSDDTDGEYPVAWIEAFLDTIEHAATELDEAGKAVRS
jgi:hypothetical protein